MSEVIDKKPDSLLTREAKAFAKSPGGWFMAGNAALNSQTNPVLAFIYAGIFAFQRWRTHTAGDDANNHILTGRNGILLVNALTTLGVAAFTLFFGSLPLALAALTFGTANICQAMIFDGKILKGDDPKTKRRRTFALTMCELCMTGGFAAIAVNAGFALAATLPLVGLGVVFAIARAAFPKIPSDLAYLDMLCIGTATFGMAVMTGNIPAAISRGLALIGITRMAVARADREGKRSLFKIEDTQNPIRKFIRRILPQPATP